MSAAAAIEARGLTRRFGPVVALHPLDLEVPAGRVLAVVGANGAGKSTLIRLLAGLGRPTAGSVAIGGAEGDRRARRARVGLVAHATLLYPALTARENLVFAGRLYGVADPAARAGELLAAFELGPVADRAVGTFSRGTAQRVAIARALVHDPPNVLLDEPTNGLDVMTTRALRDVVRRLREAGKCVVFSSHVMQEVSALCDNIVIVARGSVVASGTAAELLAASGRDNLEDAFVHLSGEDSAA